MSDGVEHDQGIEERIQSSLRSRLHYFKDQADSLTLEKVRRLLEKDLGLDIFALDLHKKFIRENLEKLMESADDCNSKPSTETVDNDADLSKDATVPQEETKKSPKRSGNKDEDITDDSPIMGVMAPKTDASPLNETIILKAISDRADHFLANSEVLTLAGVRRLLEEDLQLEKFALDPFKKFISTQVDQVLNPPYVAKSSNAVKKKSSGIAQPKKGEKISRKEEIDLSSSDGEMMEDKVESKKVTAPRKKNKTLEEPKSRKRSKESDIDDSGKKHKLIKRQNQKEEDGDSDNSGSLSEDVQPQSSNRKSAQKGKPASAFGKDVERLKSVIKACGLSIGPNIYKKAKEVPDSKREAFLIKELEGILSREGLSADPSEKEIKDCKKRRDTARELEGIDMSNIVSSSRRRSTFSFVAPPKVEIRAKAKKVVGKDNENKENNEKEHNDDNEEKEAKNEKEEKEEEEEEEEEDEEEEADDDEADEDESEEFNDDNDESD